MYSPQVEMSEPVKRVNCVSQRANRRHGGNYDVRGTNKEHSRSLLADSRRPTVEMHGIKKMPDSNSFKMS